MKELEIKVEALEKVLFILISWLHRDLGEAGVRQLDEIYDEAIKEGNQHPEDPPLNDKSD